MSTITLEPMSPQDFTAWRQLQAPAYAAAKVKAGNWTPAEAPARAEKEMAELLPQGCETPEHRFWHVLDAGSRQVVGHLWVKAPPSPAAADAFIYDIEMLASQRGRGYGEATLKALQALLTAEGFKRLRLHVFGDNPGARRLYERVGFRPTNINMALDL